MPVRCVLELQYDCNLRCKTCNIWKKGFKIQRQLSRDLSSEEINEIQSRLASSGISQISYVGGEPFFQKNIFEIISIAKKNQLSTAVVTNGTLLNSDSINQIFDSGLNTIIFSIDGPQRIHDRIRGVKGTFEKIYQNILKLQQLKKKNGLKKPKVNIYTTISRLNHLYILDMLDIAQKLDVNAIRFQLVSVVTDHIVNKTSQLFDKDVINYHSYAVPIDLKLEEKDRLVIIKKISGIQRWSEETGIQLQIEGCLCEVNPIKTCHFVKRSFVINPSGDVLPCPMLTGYSIGNILENELEDLWENKPHRLFLDTLGEVKHLPVCAVCCVEKLNEEL